MEKKIIILKVDEIKTFLDYIDPNEEVVISLFDNDYGETFKVVASTDAIDSFVEQEYDIDRKEQSRIYNF